MNECAIKRQIKFSLDKYYKHGENINFSEPTIFISCRSIYISKFIGRGSIDGCQPKVRSCPCDGELHENNSSVLNIN